MIIEFFVMSLLSVAAYLYYKRAEEPTKKKIIQILGAEYIAPEEKTRMRNLRNLVNGRKMFRRELPVLIAVLVICLFSLLFLYINDQPIV